ncbi:hypothetical protein, partial [Thiolapillus sp.]|uniref:hypothetical protein n=1 Tax=Thiolapillus sp. TaxID=2017437 RepID=UPI003AF6114C
MPFRLASAPLAKDSWLYSGASSLLLNPSIFLSLITFNKGFFRNNMEITALAARFRAARLYVA